LIAPSRVSIKIIDSGLRCAEQHKTLRIIVIRRILRKIMVLIF